MLMSDGDSGWAERVTGHTPALSADGVVQHKKLHVNQPPSISVPAPSPVDRGSTPPATNGRLSLRGYVGRLQAKARSAGRAIAGVHSPRLKHSLSDDMELGGFGLLNGTGPRSEHLPLHLICSNINEVLHVPCGGRLSCCPAPLQLPLHQLGCHQHTSYIIDACSCCPYLVPSCTLV